MPIYMKFEGIDGEVTATGHEKWIELDSFSFGVTNPSTRATGGAGAGKASFQDIHIVKHTDAASPKLMLACVSGTTINPVQIDFVKADSTTPYLKYVLEDVLVSGFQWGGSQDANDTVPAESVGINFAKIEIDYTPPTFTSPIVFNWDILQNSLIP
jgi:type VI secretion system secreted protein Hcp